MRDVTSCVRKTSWTNESEVSSPVTDVSVLYVRVVVLRPKACCLLGPKNRLFRRRPRPSGIRPAPYDPGKRCTLPRHGVARRERGESERWAGGARLELDGDIRKRA